MCNPEAVYPTCTVSETNLKLSSAECRKTEHSSKFSNSLIAFFKVAKQKKKNILVGVGSPQVLRDLGSLIGMEAVPHTVVAQSPKCWTAREFPTIIIL